MTEYNWNENISLLSSRKVALETKDLHVYYGKKNPSRALICSLKNKITA